MTRCGLLPRYLDNELPEAERASFAEHLSHCPSCRETELKWREAAQDISSMARDFEQTLHVSSRPEVDALIARAKAPKAPQSRTFIVMKPALIGAGLLLLVGILFFSLRTNRPEHPTPKEIEVLVFRSSADRPKLLRTQITTDSLFRTRLEDRLLMHIDDDLIGLGPDSNLRIMERTFKRTHIRLERGAMACQVEPRQQRGEFVVDAGPLSIRVKGTRFAVNLYSDDKATVGVVEGRVEIIDHANRTHLLENGEKLKLSNDLEVELARMVASDEESLNQLLSSHPNDKRVVNHDEVDKPEQSVGMLEVKHDRLPEKKSLEKELNTKEPDHLKKKNRVRNTSEEVSIEQMRDWILAERFTDAKRALHVHLKTHPSDSEAWNLLADCSRKEGLFAEAFRAYEKVIALGQTREAQRARFRAGALMQDKLSSPERAVPFFEEYLKEDSQHTLLKAEALFRLGRSYFAIGKLKEAKKVLTIVIEQHSGSAAAPRARRMLEKID